MAEFYPHEIAEEYLIHLGVNFDAIYNGDGGIKRAQLTALSSAPFFKKDIKANAYKTINRLSASANKKSLDFNKNLYNTLTGTVTAGIMESLEKIDDKTKTETMIKWLPSSANEQDPFHALQYGKVMTLDAAIKKGLGVRYNCQCGFEIVDKKSSEKIDKFMISAIK